MKWIIILAVTLFFISIAGISMATPESILVRPYKVSFDLGNVGNHTINAKPPRMGENLYGISYTVYDVSINGTSHNADITIHDFSMPTGNNAKEATEVALKAASQGCGEPIVINRTIDGIPGALGIVDCPGCELSLFMYPFDYNPANNTLNSMVVVTSTYPWNEGTAALVKTIHVEKV